MQPSRCNVNITKLGHGAPCLEVLANPASICALDVLAVNDVPSDVYNYNYGYECEQ